jgi:hypothetical protein
MRKGGELNEKDCFGDFIVGFGFGVGGVPLVASPRPSPWPPSPLRFKMRGLLNSQLDDAVHGIINNKTNLIK